MPDVLATTTSLEDTVTNEAKRTVPENIERAAIEAANAAYGAVYGLDSDADGDAGADDPTADRIWQETYDNAIDELLEEVNAAGDLDLAYANKPDGASWTVTAQQLISAGTYSANQESYLLYLAGERDAARAHKLASAKRKYGGRTELERLLDAARDNDHPSTSWMMLANEAISDHSLDLDASAHILRIAAQRDAAVLEAHNRRQNLLYEVQCTVGTGWYKTWLSVGETVLDNTRDVSLDDAAWLREELTRWDNREAMLSAHNRDYAERLAKELDDTFDSDRSGQMTWSIAADSVVARLGLDDHDAAIVRKRAAQRQEDDEQYTLDHASLEEVRNAARHSTLDVTNRYAAQRAEEDAE